MGSHTCPCCLADGGLDRDDSSTLPWVRLAEATQVLLDLQIPARLGDLARGSLSEVVDTEREISNDRSRAEWRPNQAKSAGVMPLVQAMVGCLGPAGAFLSTWVSARLQESTNESIDLSLRLLRARLERLEGRVADAIEDESETAELIKLWIWVASRSHHESKLRAAANLVANHLLKKSDRERLTFSETDLFMHSLDSLSVGALEVLLTAHELAKFETRADPSRELVRVDFGRIHQRMPATDSSLLMGMIGELDRFNLLHKLGSPGVRQENYQNYPIEMTPLGWRLVGFISDASGMP